MTAAGADEQVCIVCGGAPKRVTRVAGLAYLACGHFRTGAELASAAPVECLLCGRLYDPVAQGAGPVRCPACVAASQEAR